MKLKKISINTQGMLFFLPNIVSGLSETLIKHNITYVLNIDVPEQATAGKYFAGMQNSSHNFIEAKNIISKNAKLGVFHYIPSQIVITNYINYSNLVNTIDQLIQNNFIITQISAKSNFLKPGTIILGGRLYVAN